MELLLYFTSHLEVQRDGKISVVVDASLGAEVASDDVTTSQPDGLLQVEYRLLPVSRCVFWS